jgi:hypothetical protein
LRHDKHAAVSTTFLFSALSDNETLPRHYKLVRIGPQEQNMTPEEIVTDLNTKNRDTLYGRSDFQNLSHEQVLALMDAAAMEGFKLGSNVALSMVKGALLVQLTRSVGTRTDV